MRSVLASALVPLRRYADIHGRSRRTELLCFYLLLSLVDLVILLVEDWARWLMLAFWTGTALPMIALLVRRVHDVGWSGWWLLPLAPLAMFNMWRYVTHLVDPLGPLPELPLAAQIGLGIYVLATMVLLLWDEEAGANRFGPNPRLNPEGAVPA